jgi:DNA-binding transcriptional MocR family regulator
MTEGLDLHLGVDKAAGPVAGAGEESASAAPRLAVDLRPGRPDLSSFPRTVWASSVRRALSAAPYEDLDYAEPAGLPVLRAAVADLSGLRCWTGRCLVWQA